MRSSGKSYDYLASFQRMDSILAASDTDYVEQDSVPSRDSLTFTNGYYVMCSALFVDIRSSSQLPAKYRRPSLAKLYRAFISEVVAALDGNPNCREVNIVGDGVWGVFNTPYKSDIDSVFGTAAVVSSLLDVLNYKLAKRGFEPLRVGIGIDYGRALIVKAGYLGSGINDVVYMGDVVNQAAKLCAHGEETAYDKQTMLSDSVFQNLSAANQALLQFNWNRNCYHGDVVNTIMNEWYVENCK